MQTGYFDVVAHPERIFNSVDKWTPETEKMAKEIIECARSHKLGLEKNAHAYEERGRKKRHWDEFWRLVPKDIPIVYGVDAHGAL